MNELRIEFGVQKWKCLNFRRSTYLREKQTCIWSTRDFFLFCFLAVVINNRVRAWANDAKNVICCKHLVGNKNETWKMQENSKQSIVKAWRGSEASEMGRLSMYIVHYRWKDHIMNTFQTVHRLFTCEFIFYKLRKNFVCHAPLFQRRVFQWGNFEIFSHQILLT